jgi:hypothetical protein
MKSETERSKKLMQEFDSQVQLQIEPVKWNKITDYNFILLSPREIYSQNNGTEVIHSSMIEWG